MTKRLCLSIALAVVATLLIAVPVLAAYYAYIYVEESDGNSYESLPLSVPCNSTTLIQGDFMTSTALDTRVLTGSGEALPHMVANDKVMFVTDLEAYEKKTLIFYLGATSLSSFPIIVGYDGSFETPDDDDLELGYVMELAISGYFNAETADVGHSILYKEDAFRVWISDEEEIKVAAYNSTGDEQWEMHYSLFTSGEHVVYIVCNGLGASLYVDNMVTPVDTQNLFEASTAVLSNTVEASQPTTLPLRRMTFYAHNMYWAFYSKSAGGTNIFYKTSDDGLLWSSEYTVAGHAGDTYCLGIDVVFRNNDVHIVYCGSSNNVRYRRGTPNADDSITWAAGWQTVATTGQPLIMAALAVDTDDYPFVAYSDKTVTNYYSSYVSKSSANNGTWATAGGYPLTLASMQGTGRVSMVSYFDTDKIYALYTKTNKVCGRYYNGASWSGSDEDISTGGTFIEFNGVSDTDDNVYLVWTNGTTHYFNVRYADGTFGSPVSISGSYLGVAYNDDGYVYITYASGNTMYAACLSADGFSLAYPMFVATAIYYMSAPTAYGNHIGVIYTTSGAGNTEHGYAEFPWEWNDNDNDWMWMQNNVMPYADDIQMAVDGELQLEYKPNSIIQGTTLPDEENDHDAIINWGANPAGADTSMSALQFEQSYNETYYYQYLSPGSTDIIEPEPGAMAGDMDLDRLHDNPLYPLVQVLTIPGFLTERLVWLGLAWLIVIAAMFGVHLGFDTRKDTEKPQHFILTTITGLGLSILFYTVGIFPLWVVILMSFGLVGAIIWERQPVL